MPTMLSDLSDDTRDLLSKLRRRELESIMLDNGLSYPKDPPAELSRTMIRSAGINVGQYIDEVGNFLWPNSWINRRKGKPEQEPPPVQPRTSYEHMKRQDLIKFCKEAGIEWSIRDSKAILQDKVRAHLNHG